ncbi:MAG: Crp/Fnr family transcriptional regulator [Thiogranum sp.]|nr:Crp/Fnr family transcriptional regulator [Thiogranum sp.]
MSTHDPLNSPARTRDAAPVGNGVTPAEIAVALGADAPTPLQSLIANARHMFCEPQDVLYHQGDRVDTVSFVTSGLVKLVAHLRNGRARIVRLHRPGSVLGLSGLCGEQHEHTAVAVTPVTVLRLPLGALLRLRSDDPVTYVTLVERWHDYLRDADTWITQFSTGPIRGRVARLLVFLADFESRADESQVQLLTCEEMGSILGVTSESVSRTLADFKRRHILAHHDNGSRELYETDVERLHDIAGEE